MGPDKGNLFAQAVTLLWAVCLLAGAQADAGPGPTATPAAPGHDARELFYSYKCDADTFSPSLTSFATIWALLTVVLVIIASAIYLMYVCFNKFVSTLLTA